MNKMSLYIGGCDGSDYQFLSDALNNNHKAIICSFSGHKLSLDSSQMNNSNVRIVYLTEEDKKEADQYLEPISNYLKRKIASSKDYVKNLLRRNYLIIKNVERVYAVGKILNGFIDGGTAWGCYMYMYKGGKELYFYDIDKKHWTLNMGNDPVNPPTPYGIYAGIGTRDVNNFPSLFKQSIQQSTQQSIQQSIQQPTLQFQIQNLQEQKTQGGLVFNIA
jgi:hypothetical protein